MKGIYFEEKGIEFLGKLGVVKMTVGVRRRTHEKVLYCITALEI